MFKTANIQPQQKKASVLLLEASVLLLVNTDNCTHSHTMLLCSYKESTVTTYKGVEPIERELEDGEAELREGVHDEPVVVPLHRLHVQHKMLKRRDRVNATNLRYIQLRSAEIFMAAAARLLWLCSHFLPCLS